MRVGLSSLSWVRACVLTTSVLVVSHPANANTDVHPSVVRALPPPRDARRILVALQYTSRNAFTDAVGPVSELALPHGLTDPDNAAGLFVNTGILFPHFGGQPTVLNVQLALEFEPWRTLVSPFVDVGGGGHLILGRGRGRQDAPQVEWLWSSTAGVGLKLYLQRVFDVPIGLRVLGQAFWIEGAEVPVVAAFSGWSVGAGVEYHWEVPDLRLLRQLTHGDDMPEGW